MDYVSPKGLVEDAIALAEKKAALGVGDMLIRGALSGVFLGFATSLAVVVTTQGLPPIVGAILFPVGFVMLVLLGLELATGNFALLPAVSLRERCHTQGCCGTGPGCMPEICWAASFMRCCSTGP